MKLNYEVLQTALYNIVEGISVSPHITADGIRKESKVWNIKKIINGENTPTPESWWKLHKAFPKLIPPPVYTDGRKVYVTEGSQSVSNSSGVNQANSDGGNIFQGGTEKGSKELVKLLLNSGTPAFKVELVEILIKNGKFNV